MSNKLKVVTDPGTPLSISNDIEISSKFLGSTFREDWSWDSSIYDAGAGPRIERRLAALVFFEITDFKDHLATDEEAVVGAWNALFRGPIKRLVNRHGGRVALMGPARLMIEFISSVAAVRWALEMQQYLEGNANRLDGFPMDARIAIGLDDIVDINGIPQAHGVNDPMSIIHLAQSGGVVITQAVRDSIKSRLRLKCSQVDRGNELALSDGAALFVIGPKSQNEDELQDNRVA